MTKFLNKWFRRIHRWLAWPTAALLIVIVVSRHTPLGDRLQQIQSPLIIVMAITGVFLWLLPYLVKWQRNRRQARP